jgi:arginine/lysine/ornithine decarboxylase
MDEPFKSLGAERRAMIIHQQTIIASFEPELAIETLAGLIHDPAERELAVQLVQYIPGSVDEMSADTIHLLKRFRQVLDLDTNIRNVLTNPLHASPRRHTDVYRALISEDHHESEALEAAIPKAPRATSARKPAKGKSTRRA